MQLNLPLLTLCLLGTVFLYVVQGQERTAETPITVVEPTTTAAPTTAPDTGTTTDGPPKPEPTKPETTKPETTKPEATKPEPTKPDGTTEAEPTTDALGQGPEGLTDGAIAGIAIGSIAGVAAVGGGIFGALKYTKRI